MSTTTEVVQASLGRRYRAERRFRLFGIAAICVSLSFLVFLLVSIIYKSIPAFTQTNVEMTVNLDADVLGLSDAPTTRELMAANYNGVIKKTLLKQFPDVKKRRDKKELYALMSRGAQYQLREAVLEDPTLVGKDLTLWLQADDEFDALVAVVDDARDIGDTPTRLSEKQRGWIADMVDTGAVKTGFNTTFFKAGDSREPELAGIKAALIGSAWTLLVTFLVSFPIAVAAAIYLEEFAPVNRWTDLIEVNINNLAAVPSIVFGLLGLAVFINFFSLPRSAPLVGGIVLSLMTLPTIIISSRAALKAVPPSIREAAQGLGASPVQVVFHHVLPLAMPGILTGTIIGLAQALGETAPLLMIGMVAFIVDIPQSIVDPSTVLPVQVFLWSDSPERAFVAKTSAAIVVLLAFLVVMNALAVFLRKRFERRW